MASRDQPPGGTGRGDESVSRGRAVGFIVFKMMAISALIGMGVFLIIMGGLHPAALLKVNLFIAPDNPLAFRLAWQAGLGAAFITFAILWMKMR